MTFDDAEKEKKKKKKRPKIRMQYLLHKWRV